MAAAAITTSCQKEDFDAATSNGTTSGVLSEAANVTLAIAVTQDDADTKALNTYNSGWANYVANRNGLLDLVDHRLTVQIFADGETAASATYSTVITTDASNVGNVSTELDLEDVRLLVGQNYTAVAWVDFVAEGTDADLWYNTADLTSVGVVYDEDGAYKVVPDMSTYTQETRDAYTGTMRFTVGTDGLWSYISDETNAEEATEESSEEVVTGNESSLYMTLTATRPFAKVRAILSDYSTKTAWEQYFTNSVRSINHTAMVVEGTPTSYNALTKEPSATIADLVYHSAFEQTVSGAGVGIGYVDTETLLEDNTGEDVYAAIDMNYLFPTAASDLTTANALSLKMFKLKNDFAASLVDEGVSGADAEGDIVVSSKSFATIPVITNYLTTIVGQFITEGFNFTVIVESTFDSKETTVQVADDNSTTTTQEVVISDYIATVQRNSDNEITSVSIADAIFADNAAAVIAELAVLESYTSESVITLSIAGYAETVDFSALVTAAEINLTLGETNGTTTITGLNSVVAYITLPQASSDAADQVTVSDSSAGVYFDTAATTTKSTDEIDSAAIYFKGTGALYVTDGSYLNIYAKSAAAVAIYDGVASLKNINVTATGDVVIGAATVTNGVIANGATITDASTTDAGATLTATGNVTATGTYGTNLTITGVAIKTTATVAGDYTATGASIDDASTVSGATSFTATGDVVASGAYAALTVDGASITTTSSTSAADATFTSTGVISNIGAEFASITATTDCSSDAIVVLVNNCAVSGDVYVSALYGKAKVNASSVVGGNLYVEALYTITVKDVTVKGASTLTATEGPVKLTSTTFVGNVTVYEEEGVNHNTNDTYLTMTGCTFEANVYSYINATFESSILLDDKYFKMYNDSEVLTLTVIGAKDTSFKGTLRGSKANNVDVSCAIYDANSANETYYSSNDIVNFLFAE